MSNEVKVIGGIGALFLVLFGALIYFTTKPQGPTKPQPTADPAILIRSDSNQTSPKATFSIVEFGDYQCPSCGQAYPIIKEVIKTYGDKVNFVFRNFPLSQHANAQSAAEAAEAAGAQGKYWEMHDKLYENQDKWSNESNPQDIFTSYAKDIGLNVDKFTADVKAEKYKDKITKDQNDGLTLGIDATPTFYINNQKYVGVPNLDSLKAIIDLSLATPSATSSAIPSIKPSASPKLNK